MVDDNIFSAYYKCFLQYVQNSVQEMLAKISLSNFVFCENWRRESRSLLGDVKELISVLPTFSARVGEIRYK